MGRWIKANRWMAVAVLAVGCGEPAPQAEPPEPAATVEEQAVEPQGESPESRAMEIELSVREEPPVAVQEGTPMDDTASFADWEPMADEGDCPVETFTTVRAETGIDCSTYQAEISSFAARCAPECDEASLAIVAVEAAAARCSAFCTSKSCGSSVTFIPPGVCATYECTDNEHCPAACPKREYCALLQQNEVWNCFCRDLMPT